MSVLWGRSFHAVAHAHVSRVERSRRVAKDLIPPMNARGDQRKAGLSQEFTDASRSDDHEMVAAAASGDERAWRRLVHRYKRLVYSIPRRYRLSDEDCDDIFQGVFASLVRDLPKIQDPGAITNWLITSTHRACWKASKRRPVSLEPQREEIPGEMPGDQVERWERQQSLEAALADLGGRCENLLRLLYLSPSQISYEQVGTQLGMPVGSIGPTKARCLAKLSELMGVETT